MLKIERIRLTKWRLLCGAGLILLCLLSLTWFLLRECRALDCVARRGMPETVCANVGATQIVQKLPLADAQELIIDNVKLVRRQSVVTIHATLKGNLWNETDQNLYVFIGQPTASPVSYALTADERYVTDLSYPVRNAIAIPHSNDIRIGIMSPREAAYTPQIYINDPVYADFVGRDAQVGMKLAAHEVQIELPLAEYYQRKQASVPEQLCITVATARDYVGFVDQITVMNLGVNDTKYEDKKPLPPALYPMLHYDAHLLRSVTLRETGGTINVDFETGAEIEDWAQTNLHFFFVPDPPSLSSTAPLDPSKTVMLPYAWSFYCGVYSPNRIFCKESHGTDFTYDQAYAGRAELEMPAGVSLSVLGQGRYRLELAPEIADKLRAGREQFAVLLMAGRDGFAPTSCYGWKRSTSCRLLRRFERSLYAALTKR